MNGNASEKSRDYEIYKQLLDFWAKENPIKTNKLQVLLVVNGLLLTAVNVSGGFIARNWPLYLGGAILSLVWVLSIGRTSYYQRVWQEKINKIAARYPTDERFHIMRENQEDLKNIPRFLKVAGCVHSKYYLIGAPFVFFLTWLLIFFYFSVTAFGTQVKLTTQTVPYESKGIQLKGYLAYDDALKGKRPGVLVVHEFWGLNEFAKERADKLAEMGYVALAVDMYGEGKVTQDREEARKLASHVRSTPLMRERAKAGLEVLRKHNLVDPQRLAAIGFCFGGTTVLELAYSGADVRGVVSFHGGLTAPKPEDLKNLKTRILILHGAEDPHIKPEEIKAFQDGMRQAGADWQMVYYGGAVHSFANPKASSDKSKGVAYDPKAAARSWQHMQMFLQELFAK